MSQNGDMVQEHLGHNDDDDNDAKSPKTQLERRF